MFADRQHRLARGLVAALAAVAMSGAIATSDVAAEGPTLPGMCNGRSDANVVINAHANGATKYILNVSTDATGHPTGVLIVGRGTGRLYVDLICRVWQHLPGQEPGGGGGGGCEGHDDGHDEGTEMEGATIVHAVGIGYLRNGTKVLVRTDARETEEGRFVRVRYREMGSHHGGEPHTAAAMEEPGGGCSGEDEEWTRIPAEGWMPLDQLSVRVVAS